MHMRKGLGLRYNLNLLDREATLGVERLPFTQEQGMREPIRYIETYSVGLPKALHQEQTSRPKST